MGKKSKKKKQTEDPNFKTIARNRKARQQYEIMDDLECGIALVGSEVKSARSGKVSLNEAYGRVQGGEVYLVGCDIAEYPQANLMNHEPKRPRKLLLHRREIRKFAEAAAQGGLTLVPLAMYFKKGVIKVSLATARGRKLHDKREKMRGDTAKMEMRRAMASRDR